MPDFFSYHQRYAIYLISTSGGNMPSRPTLATVVTAYLKGKTYDEWQVLSGLSRGGINALAIGKTTKPHPDTLRDLAKGIEKGGNGIAGLAYLEMMSAAGYMDYASETEELLRGMVLPKGIPPQYIMAFARLKATLNAEDGSVEEARLINLLQMRETDPSVVDQLATYGDQRQDGVSQEPGQKIALDE